LHNAKPGCLTGGVRKLQLGVSRPDGLKAMPLNHLPIQRKLVGFIFLTTLTVLLGSYLVLLFYESRSSAEATTHGLKTMADIIASNSTAALIYDDPKLAEEILAGLRAETDITAAALYDKQGRIYAVYPANLPHSAIPATPDGEGARFSVRELVLYEPVVQGKNQVGTLFIRSNLGGLYRRLSVYGGVLLCVLAGGGVLAFLLSNFLQRQISQPILNLAEAARAVSERKDYSVRATKQSGDELGFVTDAFNSMLEQIQLSHAVLGESEERFRVVADSAPVLIWIAGTDMRTTWFNKHWLNFVGRPMASEVGGGWMDNLHPEDRRKTVDTIAEAFTKRQYFRIECRLRQYDGEYRWLLNQGTPRYQGGEFAGFIGSCVDITDNKEAEAAVRLSELQLRLVTDHASVFICQIDRAHRFMFVNRAYARRFDKEPQDIVGRALHEILGVSAYQLVRDRLEAALQGARQEFEIELPYSTLGLRWVHVVYEPLRTEGGLVVGIVSVLADITQRQLAARELERARDEAVNASRAKDDFLAALSHELRTPLNPVLLLATDASSNPDLPPEVREDFETIRKNVELEARLIDDLLDLTRITNGKMALAHQEVDVHTVVRDALSTVKGDLAARKIEVALRLADGRPVVRGDPVRLQQVFWNVLKNAVKFTPEGGKVGVATLVEPTTGLFTLRVTDNGIGITAPELSHIFDAFVQGDHSRGVGSHRFGGLGLGLAISRKIVELHSGRISAASEGRNQGSTFVIEIPLETVAQGSHGKGTPGEALAQPLTRSPADAGGARLSILLVEDHSPTRVALERLLQRRNYRVFVAGSATEARNVARAEKLDLVISDIGLPDASGYELMADLERSYGLKGIALTGYGMDGDIARSRATGFAVHLMKPVSMQALDAAIATISPVALQS
jgi:PAS domain S-box-containing protein